MKKPVRYKASPPEVVLKKNAETYRRIRALEKAVIEAGITKTTPGFKFAEKFAAEYGCYARQVYRDLPVIVKANELDQK